MQVYREGRKKQIESMAEQIMAGKERRDEKGRTDHDEGANVKIYGKDNGSIIKEQMAKVKNISKESALVLSFIGKSNHGRSYGGCIDIGIEK